MTSPTALQVASWKKLPVGRVNTKRYDRIKRETIWTTGHPRSGNTWVNRLLSDALNSALQVQPGYDVQYWGNRWDGPYVIRKTHSKEDLNGPVVYIQRDPRDSIVSAMHYRNNKDMDAMLEGRNTREEFEGLWGYRDFIEKWLPHLKNPRPHLAMVWYEDLHRDGPTELRRIVYDLIGEHLSETWAEEVCRRQQFDVASARLGDEHSMWVGKVDNWKRYFSRESAEIFDRYLGELTMELGYIEDRDWWRKL